MQEDKIEFEFKYDRPLHAIHEKEWQETKQMARGAYETSRTVSDMLPWFIIGGLVVAGLTLAGLLN